MKAIGLVLCTLGIALFAGAASASAGDTHTTTAWTHSTGSAYSLSALPLEDYGDYDHKGEHDSDHSGDHDRDHHGDHDRGHDHDHDHDRAPAPAPEPLTALLFGAAMLIGGGFLRRQHRKSQS